jgi:hypothetical protein
MEDTMIDWNRDIVWPDGEKNLPDVWIDRRFHERLEGAPWRTGNTRETTKRKYVYNGVPASPLAQRLSATLQRERIPASQAQREIERIAGRRLGNSTISDLLNERFPQVARSTASAVEAWLQTKEHNHDSR